jgi:hypothetical protein
MMNRTGKGRARLYVPDGCAPEDAKMPVAGVAVYESVKLEDQFELWKNALTLPDGYEVVGIFYEIYYLQWVIVIESSAIPLPPQHEMIPQIWATWEKPIDGKIRVVDLRLEGSKEAINVS